MISASGVMDAAYYLTLIPSHHSVLVTGTDFHVSKIGPSQTADGAGRPAASVELTSRLLRETAAGRALLRGSACASEYMFTLCNSGTVSFTHISHDTCCNCILLSLPAEHKRSFHHLP